MLTRPFPSTQISANAVFPLFTTTYSASSRENLRSKSSGLKCTEHITERLEGCHLALFCFTNSTHFFLRLLASGRSSSKKGIKCSDMPRTSSFWLLQPAATQTVGISFVRNSRSTSEDKRNYVDFTEIGSGIDVPSSHFSRWLLHSDLNQNGVFLSGIFPNSKNHRKSRI